MTKLWESESVSLDANQVGVYGHTRTKQPYGAVYVAPKIEGIRLSLRLEARSHKKTIHQGQEGNFWLLDHGEKRE